MKTAAAPRRVNRAGLLALAILLAAPGAAQSAVKAKGSVEQVQVTGRQARARSSRSSTAADARSPPSGPARSAAPCSAASSPGTGYRVRRGGEPRRAASRVLPRPLGPAEHASSTGSKLPTSGYGYLTTRDGTKLAINVHLPCRRRARTRRWSSTRATATPTRRAAQSSIAAIANLLGYAVVDVNMRGTGCSGGAFDYFEPLQGLDGYDVDRDRRAPAVGAARQGRDGGHLLRRHQPAVRGRDPAAEPGRDHAAVGDRQHGHDALPRRHPQHRLRPVLGQGPRARRQARVGDRRPEVGAGPHPARATRSASATRRCTPRRSTCSRRCGSEQLLRAGGRRPAGAGHVRATRSRRRSSWPASGPTSRPAGTARRSHSASPAPTRKWFTFTNGTHIDSLDPATFNRWYDFLELYVARRTPKLSDDVKAFAPTLSTGAVMGVPDVTLPEDPIQAQPDLRGRAGGVRGAAAGADPVRQRRRRRGARHAASGLRAVLRPLPAARARRPARGTSARAGR